MILFVKILADKNFTINNDSAHPRVHPTESHDLFNQLAKKLVCSVATLVTARNRRRLE